MPPLTAEPLSRVRREAVRWLWPAFLPRAKLTLLDGDPGVGKSFVTVDLAARLSRGRPLPCGTPTRRPHTVLLLNAEDSAADTTRPRAEAAGADLDRLHIVSADDPLHLPDCIPDLERLIALARADLLVIDPLMAFLPPSVPAGLDQCVRAALTPLAELAERTGCGVLMVRHLQKRPSGSALRRGQGSMGIIGAARSALLAGPHPSDPTLRVLALSKSNLTDERPALTYRLVPGANGLPVVEWGGRVDVTADAVGGKPPAVLKPRDRAAAWLHAELQAGPRPAAELRAAAAAAGIPDVTLRRAKKELRAEAHKAKRNGRMEWFWFDPSAAWPKDAPFKKPYELPPLPDLPPIGDW